jgi:hypothetical protein
MSEEAQPDSFRRMKPASRSSDPDSSSMGNEGAISSSPRNPKRQRRRKARNTPSCVAREGFSRRNTGPRLMRVMGMPMGRFTSNWQSAAGPPASGITRRSTRQPSARLPSPYAQDCVK